MEKTDNELIANFMGYEIGVIDYFGTPEETVWQKLNKKRLDELQINHIGTYMVNFEKEEYYDWQDVAYDTSWDWIMPVVEKINKIEVVDIRREILQETIWKYVSKVQILDAHMYVVEFIKWYNAKKL